MMLDEQILTLLRTSPGQRAEEIAKQLGVDRRSVSSVLHSELRGRVRQDNGYRWWTSDRLDPRLQKSEGPQSVDTPLTRLCRYYLECLGHDDLGGVSVFAESKYGDLDYTELRSLPILDDDAVNRLESSEVRRLLSRLKRDSNRLSLFLGYPTRLNRVTSRRGWEGFFVEPLFLFAAKGDGHRDSQPEFVDQTPQVNFRALRAFVETGEAGLIEEVIQLCDELGLLATEAAHPEPDELFSRLREIRPAWDWREQVDPHNLITDPPISKLDCAGIYNRAVLVVAERSPYTRGLESELVSLQAVGKATYEQTALGAWLSNRRIESPAADESPLLEVLPLNSEQRQGVRQALTSPLTVITGPPGTGKSQVVTSILVNAAWQGKTVLFASKNNKAVDVVEIRTNALGPRSVLMRLGSSEYQGKLAEYLIGLLAARSTKDDELEYEEALRIHQGLVRQSELLDCATEALLNTRNEVDRLDQIVERFRAEWGQERLLALRAIDSLSLEDILQRFHALTRRANRQCQSAVTRLLWPLLKGNRYAALAALAEPAREIASQIGVVLPGDPPDDSSISHWILAATQLEERGKQARDVRAYFTALETLLGMQSLEDVAGERRKLTDERVSNSELLWRTWLRLQPSRLSPEERKLLGDYTALLQLIVSANESGRRLGKEVFQRYYKLFPKITSIFSCWAVTSLSARGRIPFEPNFFDILVIDEASQCDIASALPLLFRARRVVVIGDPKQLRHISSLRKQQDQQFLLKYQLLDEHPGWAYSTRSLFDLASSLCASEDIVNLRDHHRSHSDIIEFSNQHFYEGRLRVATRYDRLRFLPPDEPIVRWIDFRGEAVRPGGGSAVNETEARAVVEELRRLITRGYKGSIGVVTPFRAQANRIRELVYQHQTLSGHIAEHDLLIDVIHKFQGDERDVMLFSPVVAKGISDGAIRFLRENPNLFNVAITRARSALVVIGDRSAALNSNVDYLMTFAEYIGKLGSTSKESGGTEARELGPQYPPVSNPEQVSDWERLFYQELYRAGLRSIPQYSVDKYLLDLALVKGERRLDIEIDGERYHRDWNGELCRRDQIRNQRLMELGWDIMRFWVYQIRDDLGGCKARVKQWFDQQPTDSRTVGPE